MGRGGLGFVSAGVLSLALTLGSTASVGAAQTCGKPGPGADLAGCNFADANLKGVNLTGANLTDADLTGARYDAQIRWPSGFDPAQHGLIFLNRPSR